MTHWFSCFALDSICSLVFKYGKSVGFYGYLVLGQHIQIRSMFPGETPSKFKLHGSCFPAIECERGVNVWGKRNRNHTGNLFFIRNSIIFYKKKSAPLWLAASGEAPTIDFNFFRGATGSAWVSSGQRLPRWTPLQAVLALLWNSKSLKAAVLLCFYCPVLIHVFGCASRFCEVIYLC